MRRYEMMTVFDADLGEEDVESTSKKIESLITHNNGKIDKIDKLGKKRLAYEINHKREGNYSVYTFEGEPATLTELERNLKIAEEVIRFGIFKLPEK